MSRIFLSYDHDDIAFAKPLAVALEKAGHTVWYDRQIHGGAQYSHKIEQALDAAHAVVVLWSPQSLESAWVRDEAAEGRDRGKLVPLTIGGVTPPIGFRQFQTIELGAWKGRGKVPRLKDLLEAVESQSENSPHGDIETKIDIHLPRPVQSQRRSPWLLGIAALVATAMAGGAWWWSRTDGLPVVEVAAANDSPRSQAAANDLFVKLGSLAQVGQGKWQMVDPTTKSGRSSLVFRVADTGSEAKPQSSLVLMDGRAGSLLWSREFSLPSGGQADLRQRVSLIAGRVLGCALESRRRASLTTDLMKLFLNACASLAEASGQDYADSVAPLRRVVIGAPRFEPAWQRLMVAESAAVDTAKGTDDEVPLRRQLRADFNSARTLFPDMPELALAEIRLRNRADFGRDIEILTAASKKAPDNAELHAELSNALKVVGRMADAVDNARRAAERDPLSFNGTGGYIMALAEMGEVDTARGELTKSETAWAGTDALAETQAAFAMRYGDPALALRLDPVGYNTVAYLRARAEPSPANIASFKAGVDEFRPKSVTGSQVAWAIQGLGQFGLVNDVFYWLDRLPNDDLAKISFVFFRPSMASVRKDPRFMPFAARAGLVGYWRSSGHWPDFCRRPGISYDCQIEAAKLK